MRPQVKVRKVRGTSKQRSRRERIKFRTERNCDVRARKIIESELAPGYVMEEGEFVDCLARR